MPKEQIKSCFDVMAEERSLQPPDGPQLPHFLAEVTWGRNGYVQVATVDPAAELGTRDSGLYVDVDRNGINKLIRVLRRARDQAYGRDE